MQPLSSSQIYGNWATLLLPIKKCQGIDYNCLSEEIDRLVSFKPNGIYSNGSAGEFYNQTEEEFDNISQLLAEKCNESGIPFQIGVSHMSPILSLERLRRAVSLRPGAVQVILPDWFIPTLKESIRFLDRMAAHSEEIGLVLYNPPHAKKVLTPQEIGLIKKAIPQLVGVKVADGSTEWYKDMKEHCSTLSLFVPGHHLATGIKNGAHGSYSNVACLHPQIAQRWYEQIQSDVDGAIELEGRIRLFMSQYIAPFIRDGYSNMAADKMLAAVGGWSRVGIRLRWPYREIPEDNVIPLRNVAQELIPEFFNSTVESNPA